MIIMLEDIITYIKYYYYCSYYMLIITIAIIT